MSGRLSLNYGILFYQNRFCFICFLFVFFVCTFFSYLLFASISRLFIVFREFYPIFLLFLHCFYSHGMPLVPPTCRNTSTYLTTTTKDHSMQCSLTLRILFCFAYIYLYLYVVLYLVITCVAAHTNQTICLEPYVI